MGHELVANLIKSDFEGKIIPVNPSADEVLGLPCYPDLKSAGEKIELSVISVPTQFVKQAVHDSIDAGAGAIVIITAGFKEVSEEGATEERELAEYCRARNVSLLGPNCLGLINAHHKMNASFASQMPKAGGISIFSQSGALCTAILDWAKARQLGLSKLISMGNKADLSETDFLRAFAEDDETKVIVGYLESVDSGNEFIKAAEQAASRKPVVIFKAGVTQAGSKAASSHTGSLAGADTAYGAAFHRSGIIRAENFEAMFNYATAFAMQPLPKGDKVAIITNAGGPVIQAVDESVGQGLELARWSEAGTARLQDALFAEASLGNPVDVVATADHNHYHAAVSTLLAEADTDMVMVFFVTAPFTDTDAIAARIKEATEDSDKPVVVVVETYSEMYGLIDTMRAGGLPVFEFAEDGARALAAMNRYARLQERPREDPPELEVDRKAAQDIVGRYRGQGAYLPQAEAFALLEAYGIPVPLVATVSGKSDLETAADRVGFPCVLKVDAADVVHKSDAGGVVLNLVDMATLQDAFATMQKTFDGPDVSYLLMEQKTPGQELILGAKASLGLGSLVMFGLGGVFVEVLKDVGAAVAPLSRAEARELMQTIKGYPLLEGLRGR
ncbi:CoA-binding protein, partial [bacterium]